jgi:hypothetical protein
MPRSEARIFTSIWKDGDFIALPRSAQALYMFLLSQDDLAYCGVLPLRQPRWAKKAAGLTTGDIESDLKALEGTAYPSPKGDWGQAKTPFLIIDRDSGEVFIRSLIRRDGIWKQPNLLKQARDTADQIESPQIRAALVAELRRLPLEETASELVRTLVAEFIQDLEEGSPYPSAYPPDETSDETSSDPTGNSSADPSQGYGEGNGLSKEGSPVPQDPPSPVSPSSSPRDRKLGTRIPDDFEDQIRARPDLADWFRENCPHVDGKRETARFRDHWVGKPGKDGRKLDWIATWRNWMRTAEDRAMPRQRGGNSRQQETEELFEQAAMRIAAREESA